MAEIWTESRHTPVHSLSDHLGVDKSKVAIKAHIVIGQDSISKTGTKH